MSDTTKGFWYSLALQDGIPTREETSFLHFNVQASSKLEASQKIMEEINGKAQPGDPEVIQLIANTNFVRAKLLNREPEDSDRTFTLQMDTGTEYIVQQNEVYLHVIDLYSGF